MYEILGSRSILGPSPTSEDQEAEQQTRATFAVPLKRTEDPVWPKDEEFENRALIAQGKPLSVMASPSFAEKVIGEVTFGLAERLFVPSLPPDIKEQLDTTNWAYVGFGVPLSYDAPEQLLLWRLKLTLEMFIPELAVHGVATSPTLPVAILMDPMTDIATTTPLRGEVGLHLGKIAGALEPMIPEVLIANFDTSFQATKYHPRIQASGPGTHICRWRVADPEIASGFRPAVMVQLPARRRLAVLATLHIEIRKQVAGIFHRVYALSDPDISLLYVHAPEDPVFYGINPNLASSELERPTLANRHFDVLAQISAAKGPKPVV